MVNCYSYGLTVKVDENLIHKEQPYKYNGSVSEESPASLVLWVNLSL